MLIERDANVNCIDPRWHDAVLQGILRGKRDQPRLG
jgi:hypothetical protein